MKNDKKFRERPVPYFRASNCLTQGARLAAAGYPKFLFRLAAARRAWVELSGVPRRHD
jgi:hypothetical protein